MSKEISKQEYFLQKAQSNLNEWVCMLHNSVSSTQPVSLTKLLRNKGYSFEEVSPKRWCKSLYCETCKTKTTHVKLLHLEPVFTSKPRISIDKKTREKIINLLDSRDAFTGVKITSITEIDHKVPFRKLEQDIDASKLSDEELLDNFQLLTNDHNLLKDRACLSCEKTNIRPPFFEVNFFYEGDENYLGSCVGCGWYDGAKWSCKLNEKLSQL